MVRSKKDIVHHFDDDGLLAPVHHKTEGRFAANKPSSDRHRLRANGDGTRQHVRRCFRSHSAQPSRNLDAQLGTLVMDLVSEEVNTAHVLEAVQLVPCAGFVPVCCHLSRREDQPCSALRTFNLVIGILGGEAAIIPMGAM